MPRVLVYHPTQSARYATLVRPHADQHGLDVTAVDDPKGVETDLPETEILLAANSFPVDTLGEATALRWIHVMGAGVDRWMHAALAPGVRVTRTVGTFGARMAEYAFAHILAVHQSVHAYRKDQESGRWNTHNTIPLSGRRIGIAGVGAIGSTLAKRAQAFEMDVVGFARTARTDGPFEVFGHDQLHPFLNGLDVVVNILPLTDATRHLFGPSAFSAMRNSAWFVNMGRGATVDEVALIHALRAGAIGGAVLDVFQEEPLPPSSPLWSMDNVVITPHISGTSIPEEVVDAFIANVPRFLRDQPMLEEIERARAY